MDTFLSHWQRVYRNKPVSELSWFQASPARSLELIRDLCLPKDAKIIDVGGGASTLVDELLALGYRNLTVLDIAKEALEAAQRRLGAAASRVNWIVSDVTTFEPLGRFDLWHDRAVFHFLFDEEDQRRYRSVLLRALSTDGHVVIATFGPEGPDRCSGLPTVRYSCEELSTVLDGNLTLKNAETEEHLTPGGVRQQFQYCVFEHGAH